MASESCGCVGVLDAPCQVSHHPQQEPFHRTARQHPAPRAAPLACRFHSTRYPRGAQTQKEAQIKPQGKNAGERMSKASTELGKEAGWLQLRTFGELDSQLGALTTSLLN